MRRVCRFGLVILILVSCTGCDQATKSVAREWLAASPPVSMLNDFVRFEYTENPGAFLGVGSGLPSESRFLLLVIFASASLLLALALIARVRSSGLGPLTGVSLLAGGGVGNLIDRIFNNGTVVDFVRLGIGCVRTGVFNLADVAIMVGLVMLLVSSAREMKGAGNAA
jgi:signal peptidase II